MSAPALADQPPVAARCTSTVSRAAIAFLTAGAFALAAALRLTNLHLPRGELDAASYDEGIRLAQLALMDAGYRPFRDIYASQGPLLLDYFAAFYTLFGRDVGAARLGAAAGSLLCLAGVYLAARRLWGGVAGLLAVVLLGVSPLFLQVSRHALAEAPSVGLAALAFWAALVYRRSGGSAALVGCLACLALAVLLKPMAGVVLVPIALALAPGLRRLRPAAWLGGAAVALLVAAAVVWYVGPRELVESFVQYRLGALGRGTFGDEPWSPAGNLTYIRQQLFFDQPWVVLAIAACWPLLRVPRSGAMLAVAWLGASLGLLLVYSPLSWKHAAYLLPPAALLAGGGLAAFGRGAAALLGGRPAWSIVPIGLALGWLLASAPAIGRVDADLAVQPWPAVEPAGDLADALAILDRLTAPGDYLVTDHPYLAYLAGRLVPPRLADPSRTRVRAGALPSDEAIAETERFEAAAVVLWANRLVELEPYTRWVAERYVLVQLYHQGQAIYLRPDLAARLGPAGLGQPALHEPVRFEDSGLELLAAALEPGPTPESPRLLATWRASPNTTAAYVLVVELLDPAGGLTKRLEHALTPPWDRAPWTAGLALRTRHSVVPFLTPPGQYTIQLKLRRLSSPATLPPRPGPAGGIPLGSVTIR